MPTTNRLHTTIHSQIAPSRLGLVIKPAIVVLNHLLQTLFCLKWRDSSTRTSAHNQTKRRDITCQLLCKHIRDSEEDSRPAVIDITYHLISSCPRICKSQTHSIHIESVILCSFCGMPRSCCVFILIHHTSSPLRTEASTKSFELCLPASCTIRPPLIELCSIRNCLLLHFNFIRNWCTRGIEIMRVSEHKSSISSIWKTILLDSKDELWITTCDVLDICPRSHD